jgi:methyl coenzyme M reductase subunit C
MCGCKKHCEVVVLAVLSQVCRHRTRPVCGTTFGYRCARRLALLLPASPPILRGEASARQTRSRARKVCEGVIDALVTVGLGSVTKRPPFRSPSPTTRSSHHPHHAALPS